jgi:hypothetical protein
MASNGRGQPCVKLRASEKRLRQASYGYFLVGISLRCHDFVSSVLTAWDSHQHLHITKAYMSNTAVIELYETIPFLFPCQTTR